MSIEQLTQNWALVAASVLGTAIVLFVVVRLVKDSVRGRLGQELRHLGEREKARRKAERTKTRAAARIEKLRARADSARPRDVDEAKTALAVAEQELRMIEDHVLIARNRVRTIILEEYPPKRHAAMRRRYLGEKDPA